MPKEGRPAYIAPNVPKKRAGAAAVDARPAFIQVCTAPDMHGSHTSICNVSHLQSLPHLLAMLYSTVAVVFASEPMSFVEVADVAGRYKTRSLSQKRQEPCLLH